MQLLQRNEQKWRRRSLLDRGVTSGSGLKWKQKSRTTITNDDYSSSKENNDEGSGQRRRRRESGGGGIVLFTPRKAGNGRLSTSTTSRARGGTSGKIYIDALTVKAMEEEIQSLPLPATLTAVGIALRTSKQVLNAHADGDYTRLNDDDGNMKKLEIMGTHLDNMSVNNDNSSPEKRGEERLEEFKGACMSVTSGGNSTMLNSWEEVEKELSRVFLFARVDIQVTQQQNEGAGAVTGNIPKLFRRSHHQRASMSSSTKLTPKRATRLSPKKARHSMATPIIAIAKKVGGHLTVGAFREHMKHKMGASTYQRIFQQGEILSTKPSIASSYDEEARRLDEQIQQKESERRSDREVEEALARREKERKEKEARDAALKLMRPLTTEEQQIVNSAIRGIGPPAEILARQDADSVQRGSMQTLMPGQWLNDEIINYFLKNCLAKRDENLCAKTPGRKRSHFFNSFFVQTMFDEKNNNMSLRGRYNYKNVKRWSKKVPGKDIFNLKYIVCPINLDNLHWTSAVIFMEEKRIQYYDSMGGTDRAKLEGLLEYLKDEYRAKKGGELDADEWTLVNCTRDTPRQRNGFDCGVFTCMFCDFISKDCPLVFNQDHIDQCRERIALSIMKNCAIE